MPTPHFQISLKLRHVSLGLFRNKKNRQVELSPALGG